MNILKTLQLNILYFFISLPLIIVGYVLLMCITTAKGGWIFLVIGLLILVPFVYVILSYISNLFFSNYRLTTINQIFYIVILVLIIVPLTLIVYYKPNAAAAKTSAAKATTATAKASSATAKAPAQIR